MSAGERLILVRWPAGRRDGEPNLANCSQLLTLPPQCHQTIA
jgi:hypothetical protein